MFPPNPALPQMQQVIEACELDTLPPGAVDMTGDPDEVCRRACVLAGAWVLCAEASTSTDTARRLVAWARRVAQKINLPGPLLETGPPQWNDFDPIITRDMVETGVHAALDETALNPWPF
jgi:hypothetical protein